MRADTLNYGNVAATFIALLIAAILIGSWTPKMHFLKREVSDVSQIMPTKTSATVVQPVVERDASHGVATPSPVDSMKKPMTMSEHHEQTATTDFWLDGFTFLLVVVAALQFAWMVRQEKIITNQGKAIAGLKELAEKQTSIAATQVDIAEKTHDVGRLQYLASHRPELKIRGISINELKVGEKVSARVLVANSGSSRTTIQQGTATILISKDANLIDLPDYDDARVNIRNPSLEPGSKNSFTKVSDFILSQEQYECIFAKNKKGGGALYLFGYLDYVDSDGNKRTTGFCRKYDPGTKRFKVVADEKYEYID